MGLDMKDIARMSPRAQRQILEKLSAPAASGPKGKGTVVPFPKGGHAEAKPKYGNRPTERILSNGTVLKFDSMKEARRFDELFLMLQAGQIRNLRLQVQFLLKPSYISIEGTRERAINYIADFTYERPTDPDCNQQVYWLKVVEDAKGRRTKDYSMKKKMMHDVHGIDIKEV